jgi:hypothetical protein
VATPAADALNWHLARAIPEEQRKKIANSYFFLPDFDGFFACERSDATTVFSSLEDDLLPTSFPAFEAGFLPVTIANPPMEIAIKYKPAANRSQRNLIVPASPDYPPNGWGRSGESGDRFQGGKTGNCGF